LKVIVPFRLEDPKARLSVYLKREEREELALCMLSDVLKAISKTDVERVTVLLSGSSDERVESLASNFGAELEFDKSELSKAINRRLEALTAVIVSDLPLLSKEVVKKFFELEGDVVIAPGRRGGTNMLLTRKEFRVSYHYGSYLKHVTMAKRMNYTVKIFDSFFAGCDVDTPDDLLEVMIHSPNSETCKCLRKLGFRLLLEKNPKIVRVRNYGEI